MLRRPKGGPHCPSTRNRGHGLSGRGGCLVHEAVVGRLGCTLGQPSGDPRSTVHRDALTDGAHVLEALAEVVALRCFVRCPGIEP